MVLGLGEDHGGVQLDAGETRVRSTPVLTCGGVVEGQPEGELRQ